VTKPSQLALTTLHLDDLAFRIPADADVAQLRKAVAAAMRTGAVIEVEIVEPVGGGVIATLVRPASAKIAYVKSIDVSYRPGSIDPGKT
jgi:hypothetical protein